MFIPGRRARRLEIRALRIPFRQRFRHAAAERSATETIWVRVQAADGTCGHGEGCPRPYVTGETMVTALAFCQAVQEEVAGLSGVDELQAWVAANEIRIDANPAAWCAIELALLDLIGREEGQAVEALLALPPLEGSFRYTAVLGAEDSSTFAAQLENYLRREFRDFKAKLSGEPAADQGRLRHFAAHARSARSLRLDANNRWRNPGDAVTALRDLAADFFAVEEPLAAGNYAGLRRVAAETGVRIILDESFLRREQFAALGPLPGPWILNLRISKLGGLLRSLAVARRAIELGVPVIIGCQVGETSLLTRAALALAMGIRDSALLGREGAFGTHLLSRDVVACPLEFGVGGILDVNACEFPGRPGFGLDVTEL